MRKPTFAGRHTVFHGFGRDSTETHPGLEPFTWWGSSTIRLPAGTNETNVRLQAEDGAHSSGILYSRGGEKTAVVFNHPRADFSSHYLIPAMIAAGFAAFGGQTRYLGNDINCEHECLCVDLAAQIRFLRAKGFEKVVLLGNSGGGPLSTFYQSQAVTQPPRRLTDTAAGNPYDLNALDLSPADGLILLAAAVSEGFLGLENLDPSVTDERDPLSCDASLDMFDPANGYRQPPEPSSYDAKFLERYRAAQRTRCARIDAMARQEIARKRRYLTALGEPGFTSLPLQEKVHLTKLASASSTLTLYRTMANPALTDLSIIASKRRLLGLMQPSPLIANYSLPGFVSVMTAEGWLSTWSGLSTRVNLYENIKQVTQPLLIVNFEADVTILPHEAQGTFANAASADKQLVHVDADHFAFKASGDREDGIHEAGAVITDWLGKRFAAA